MEDGLPLMCHLTFSVDMTEPILTLFPQMNTPINTYRVTSGPGQRSPGHSDINKLASEKQIDKIKAVFYDSTRKYVFKNFSNLKNHVRSTFS